MLSFSKGLDGRVTASDNSKIVAPVAVTEIELQKVFDSIDPLLRPIIAILWKYGIVTRYSCQGHIDGEEGYIYMDFSMDAFNVLSKTMFAVSEYLDTVFLVDEEDGDSKTLRHPYMHIERGTRKVKDNFSKDELIVRFRFHSLNVISREEFYGIVEDKLILSFS